jgi:N-acetylglucosamine-6-phosphate deacetylase
MTESSAAFDAFAAGSGGYFDLQVNGFGGVDFQRSPSLSDVRGACEQLLLCRMTRILATFITCDAAVLREKLRRFEDYRRQDALIRNTIVGYHLEGPYLNSEPGYRGAHRGDLMKDPDWDEFQRNQEAADGRIRLVTLAPERKSAAEFIREATRSGVRISLGHTNASSAEIDEAIDAGATLCTHLGNGCPAEIHRHDNIIQRLLARDELTACFIPDGIHLPPDVFKNFCRAKPEGRVILTTDAMAAAGAGPGRYTIGDMELEVFEDEVVRLPGALNFAGSALRLDEGVRRAQQWLNVSAETVGSMASSAPAVALGFDPQPDFANLRS